MKIVINIPDQKYKWIVDNPQTYTDDLCEAIRNGTPLPEHHGDLIDRSELLKQSYRIDDSATLSTRDIVNEEEISDAPTIIEGSYSE